MFYSIKIIKNEADTKSASKKDTKKADKKESK